MTATVAARAAAPSAARPRRRSGRLGSRLFITSRAREAIRTVREAVGMQHVLLSWPAGATLLPESLHVPDAYSVIVGHVARCPIYVDLRQLHLFRDRSILLDVPHPPRFGSRPVLQVRTGTSARVSRTRPAGAPTAR